MQDTELSDLSARLLNEDEHVLEDILHAFGPGIMTLMKRRYRGVLCEADLEDVLSIGLFRLWTARDRFDDRRGSIQVWFFRIVENTARDVLKVGWQKARQLETNTPYENVSAAAVNGSVQAAARDCSASQPEQSRLHCDLRDIIADLPEAQRFIITADSLARDDVAASDWLAQELGSNASTVRVYRKRALERIRKELKKRGH